MLSFFDLRCRPPAGCLQYFTTYTGRISTFNFLSTTTSHLATQEYELKLYKCSGIAKSVISITSLINTEYFRIHILSATESQEPLHNSHLRMLLQCDSLHQKTGGLLLHPVPSLRRCHQRLLSLLKVDDCEHW